MARKSKKQMAQEQARQQRQSRRPSRPARKEVPMPFGRINYLLFGAGLLAVVLGFVTLASGSDTLAPILLVAGYCLIIPVAILWKDKGKDKETTEQTSGG
jgi:hypothetical protein